MHYQNYDKQPSKKHQFMTNPVLQLRKINDKTSKVLNFDEICSDDWDDCDSCKFDYEAEHDNERLDDDMDNVEGGTIKHELKVTDSAKKLTKSVNFDQIGGGYNDSLAPDIVV